MEQGEVPIACLLVQGELGSESGHDDQTDGALWGKLVAFGVNGRGVAHAEIMCLLRAVRVRDWRMEDCVAFVSCEPCDICHAAFVHSRVGSVVYGCANPKYGAISRRGGTSVNLPRTGVTPYPTRFQCFPVIECHEMLRRFFRSKRSDPTRIGED